MNISDEWIKAAQNFNQMVNNQSYIPDKIQRISDTANAKIMYEHIVKLINYFENN